MDTGAYTERKGPPIHKVEAVTRFVDTNGVEHASYSEAYRASVRDKLTKILQGCRCDGWIGPECRDKDIADLIMGSLTVSWS